MRGMPVQPEIPLRPMTLGELLDAAMSVVRLRALPLLATAAGLATLEQLALAPLRAGAHLSPPWYGPADDHLSQWWEVAAAGLGLEAAIVTVIGSVAGAAVLVRRPGRPAVTALAAMLLAVICAGAAYLGFVGWIFAWGFFGLTGPVLAIDRARNPFTALGRSAALASREGLRGLRILLAGYLTWFVVRLAFGAGWLALAEMLLDARPAWAAAVAPVAWGLADTVAYAALGAIAAVLVVDVRVRTEGLDIAIRRGGDVAAQLRHVP